MTQADPLCLVTRPQPEAARFAQRVEREMGMGCLLSPLLKIIPLSPPDQLGDARGVILTSARGAEALGRWGVEKETPCFAVGDKTAKAAQSLGFQPTVAHGDAESLLALLLDLRPAHPLIHIRGAHSRGDIARRLTEAGLPCREIIAYRQVKQGLTEAAREALGGGQPVIAPLFSPRTAEALRAALPPGARPLIAALSPAVAQAFWHADVVALRPTEDALLSAMRGLPVIRAWVEKAGMQD
ncbi:MAG: uroporphyrinogen-III synthase [Pseudomonadota bacterium]